MQERQVNCTTWCTALGFMLCFLIGGGEIALEIWLILHYTGLAEITGVLIYISYAFLASGGLASITGLLGFSGIVKMNKQSFLMSLVFIPLTVACQAGVWTAMCVEQIQVVAELPDTLNSSSQYYKFIDYHYNCQLQNASGELLGNQLMICISFLTRQLWVYLYSLLGLCISLICIYSVLLLVAFKIIHKIKKKNNQVAQSPDHEPPFLNPARSLRRQSTVTQSIQLSREPTLTQLYGSQEPPTAPPPPTVPSSAPPISSPSAPPLLSPVSLHPAPLNFDHSGIFQRGNFNGTKPLPNISPHSYDEHQMELYQQDNPPSDWNDSTFV